jgi:hypothetical protein
MIGLRNSLSKLIENDSSLQVVLGDNSMQSKALEKPPYNLIQVTLFKLKIYYVYKA